MDETYFLINQSINPSEKIPTKDGLYIRLYDLLDRYKKQLLLHDVSESFYCMIGDEKHNIDCVKQCDDCSNYVQQQ